MEIERTVRKICTLADQNLPCRYSADGCREPMRAEMGVQLPGIDAGPPDGTSIAHHTVARFPVWSSASRVILRGLERLEVD